MKTIIGLSYIAVLPVIASIILYLLDKKTKFSQIDNKIKQIIYGVVFGGLAVLGTEFGVDIGGATANTRDASVLTAGLIFGAPAGIIAGLIGGIERYMSVLWGGGTYTQLACTLSTIIAGFFAAFLRKKLFDDKKPSIFYALAIGLVMEVFHMLMIFITNMSDIAGGFVIIQACAIPMITVNGLSVMLAVLVVTLLGKEKTVYKFHGRKISALAQRWLLGCVSAAFVLTCVFTSILQFEISERNTNEILNLNIDDVVAEITDASDRNLLSLTYAIKEELVGEYDLNEIAERYGVAEINIVGNDEDGTILYSTNPEWPGYEMNSGEQSRAFLVLNNGTESFVQSYQPISYDANISRKYAGVALPGIGFLQVGYDAAGFQADIENEVMNVALNRHVEQTGYIFIVDNAFNIVSTRHDRLETTTENDIEIDESKAVPGKCFTATFYEEKTYCMLKECEGYYIIAVLPTSEADFSRDLSIYMMVFVEVIIFVGLFILTYFLVKRLVVDNIQSVNDSLAEITGGNLNVVVNVRSNEEFASLSDDINATVDTLKQYIAEASARIDKELELAKVIQESSLPTVFPPFPEKKQIDIFASMNAAKEVGGDFYDFYLLDDDHLAFLIADVSGKGITGAMFMMQAKTIIKSFADHTKDVAEILSKANDELCKNNDAEMFVTCFMAIIDLSNGKIEFANAGHNPPLIRRQNGTFEYFKTRPGFVLAGMSGINYRKGEIDFHLGDTIFLYTDGVTEATNSDELLFGEDRLIETLNSQQYQHAQDICINVKKGVDEFVGEAPQFDDITMLCLVTKQINKEGK